MLPLHIKTVFFSGGSYPQNPYFVLVVAAQHEREGVAKQHSEFCERSRNRFRAQGPEGVLRDPTSPRREASLFNLPGLRARLFYGLDGRAARLVLRVFTGLRVPRTGNVMADLRATAASRPGRGHARPEPRPGMPRYRSQSAAPALGRGAPSASAEPADTREHAATVRYMLRSGIAECRMLFIGFGGDRSSAWSIRRLPRAWPCAQGARS
jgi:hypothetical protein